MIKASGEITGLPVFNVEIFKYVGLVSAQSVEVADYSVEVVFVGRKGDHFISPFIQRALRKTKESAKFMKLSMYSDSSSAPEHFKDRIVGGSPTIFIGDQPYSVKSKSDINTGEIQPFIADGAQSEFALATEEDLALFIIRKSSLKPDILGFGTAFQSVDEELSHISSSILSSAKTNQDVGSGDFIAKLGMDETVDALECSLTSLRVDELSEQHVRDYRSIQRELGDFKKDYRSQKSEFEAIAESLRRLEVDYSKNTITYDLYNVTRFKYITDRKTHEQSLMDLQERLKGDLYNRVQNLLIAVSKKRERS